MYLAWIFQIWGYLHMHILGVEHRFIHELHSYFMHILCTETGGNFMLTRSGMEYSICGIISVFKKLGFWSFLDFH